MMELYIFTADRKVAGIIEAYEYLRWTRRYSRCGSFELKAIANDENIALLQMDNILWKNDDEEAGLIEFLEYSQDESEYITISGRFATGFLARRIVWATEILSGDLSSGVVQLLNNHLISPTNAERRIEGISFTPTTLNKPVKTQISYVNLMDAVTNLCDAADVGIKMVFNPSIGIFNVVLYIGADTTAVFSKEYENVLSQVFTQSAAEFANTALVGGEGEGSGRTFASVGGGAGAARFEVFVDAKDLRSEDFPSGYTDALLFRGNSKLAEMAMVKAFDVTVNQYGNLKYKTDFDIGSNIQAVSIKWGVSMAARITEIEESYDRDGMSLSVTFGKPLLTLSQRLKQGDF
jgi:hypothetical protein